LFRASGSACPFLYYDRAVIGLVYEPAREIDPFLCYDRAVIGLVYEPAKEIDPFLSYCCTCPAGSGCDDREGWDSCLDGAGNESKISCGLALGMASVFLDPCHLHLGSQAVWGNLSPSAQALHNGNMHRYQHVDFHEPIRPLCYGQAKKHHQVHGWHLQHLACLQTRQSRNQLLHHSEQFDRICKTSPLNHAGGNREVAFLKRAVCEVRNHADEDQRHP